MYEFYICHKRTNEQRTLFGYSVTDAFARAPEYIREDWLCLGWSYID